MFRTYNRLFKSILVYILYLSKNIAFESVLFATILIDVLIDVALPVWSVTARLLDDLCNKVLIKCNKVLIKCNEYLIIL